MTQLKKYFLMGVFSLLVLPSSVMAEGWKISLVDSTVFSDVQLVNLRKDTLLVLQNGESLLITVGSINELRFERESRFGEGLGKGAAIGFIGGALLGGLMSTGSGMLPSGFTKVVGAIVGGAFFAVPGAVIGGTIGAIHGIDEVYDMSGFPLNGKLTTLQSVIARHVTR